MKAEVAQNGLTRFDDHPTTACEPFMGCRKVIRGPANRNIGAATSRKVRGYFQNDREELRRAVVKKCLCFHHEARCDVGCGNEFRKIRLRSEERRVGKE